MEETVHKKKREQDTSTERRELCNFCTSRLLYFCLNRQGIAHTGYYCASQLEPFALFETSGLLNNHPAN